MTGSNLDMIAWLEPGQEALESRETTYVLVDPIHRRGLHGIYPDGPIAQARRIGIYEGRPPQGTVPGTLPDSATLLFGDCSVPTEIEDAMARYPRLVAHIQAESLGYFTPEGAAKALLFAMHGIQFPCEYVDAYFNNDTPAMVRQAIRNRNDHTDAMSRYRTALAQVVAWLEHHVNASAQLAGWF